MIDQTSQQASEKASTMAAKSEVRQALHNDSDLSNPRNFGNSKNTEARDSNVRPGGKINQGQVGTCDLESTSSLVQGRNYLKHALANDPAKDVDESKSAERNKLAESKKAAESNKAAENNKTPEERKADEQSKAAEKLKADQVASLRSHLGYDSPGIQNDHRTQQQIEQADQKRRAQPLSAEDLKHAREALKLPPNETADKTRNAIGKALGLPDGAKDGEIRGELERLQKTADLKEAFQGLKLQHLEPMKFKMEFPEKPKGAYLQEHRNIIPDLELYKNK